MNIEQLVIKTVLVLLFLSAALVCFNYGAKAIKQRSIKGPPPKVFIGKEAIAAGIFLYVLCALNVFGIWLVVQKNFIF